jgi:hypothetical protein
MSQFTHKSVPVIFESPCKLPRVLLSYVLFVIYIYHGISKVLTVIEVIRDNSISF